jgi:hypothetical protein
MLLEDRFVSVGTRALGATAIALAGWTFSTAPQAQAELQLLTWAMLALQGVCLIGAWVAFGWRIGFWQRRASRLLQLIRVRR